MAKMKAVFMLGLLLCSSSLVSARLVTVCLRDDMQITVERKFVRYYKPWELTLNTQDVYNDKCLGSGNKTHITFKVGYTDCGTKASVTKRLIYYTNNIRNVPLAKGAVISRKRPVHFRFGCYFDRRLVNTVRLNLREESNVTCNLDSMEMTLPKTIVPKYKQNQLSLRDPKCHGVDKGDYFVFSTKYLECGTELITKNDHILFQNTVRNVPLDPNAVITRKKAISVVFGCYFGREFRESLLSQLKSQRKPIVKSITNFGKFTIRLEVTDEDGNKMDVNNLIEPKVGENLFIRISGDALAAAGIRVGARKCFITTEQNTSYALSYTLIDNGCAVDPTVKFLSSSRSSQRFAFEAFRFISKPDSYLYLYCDTVLCSADDLNASCASDCQDKKAKRRKRNTIAQKFIRLELVFSTRN